LKILSLQYRPCSRNFKQSAALRKKGHRVDLGFVQGGCQALPSSGGTKYGVYSFDERDTLQIFDTYEDANQMAMVRNVQKYGEFFDKIINLHDFIYNPFILYEFMPEYDIVICHNAPNQPASTAVSLSQVTGVPVIHNAHDVYKLHGKNPEADGAYIMEEVGTLAADGHLFVSPEQREMYERRYSSLPNADYIYNYTTVDRLPTEEGRAFPEDEIHLVYVGGVVLDRPHERNFTKLWKMLAANGFHVHFYTDKYKVPQGIFDDEPNIHYEGIVPEPEVSTELASKGYDAGLMFWNFDYEDGEQEKLMGSMPNKVFEYLAAQIPVLVDPACKVASEFIKEHGTGIVTRPDQFLIKPKWKDAADMRPILTRLKSNIKAMSIEDITVEGHIDVVERVCERAIERRK
jgi:hypothetical protein